MTRRSLLMKLFRAVPLLLMAARPAWGEHAGYQVGHAASRLDLDKFMQMSRVLTGFRDLNDYRIGKVYLDALNARPGDAANLSEFWTRAGVATDPTRSIGDLEAMGLFDDERLVEIADRVTGYWYSGKYLAVDGKHRVATFTEALAWRSLGYRRNGPSNCSGAFGSWEAAPQN